MARVGLLKPGRKTKSITLRILSSTWIGRSKMKLGEYGTSLFQPTPWGDKNKQKELNDLLGLRLILLHNIEFSLGLIKWEDSNGMLWERECRAARMRINTEICTEKRRVEGELRQNKRKSWMIFVGLTHQLRCSFISVNWHSNKVMCCIWPFQESNLLRVRFQVEIETKVMCLGVFEGNK